MNKNYTDEEINTIKDMYREYYLTRHIADAVGRSILSVKQKIRHLELPQRNQRVLELIKWHGRDILGYGYSPEAVDRWMNKDKVARQDLAEEAFIQFKTDLKTMPRDLCIIKAAQKGVPGVRMSFYVGLSRQRVNQVIQNDRKQRRGPRRAAKAFKG